MFLISNDTNLTIPNFLQALGFIPPAGMEINEIFVDNDSAEQVNQALENSGFTATAINPNYKTVKYQKKDPRLSFSFSDNHIIPEVVASELAEFPRHIQTSTTQINGPVPQYNIIKSPVKAVTIVEDTLNKCYMLKLNEDYLFPKGTIFKLTENESELSNVNYAAEEGQGDLSTVGSYSRAAMYAALLANDLKTLHLHAVGDDFDKIHQISQILYEEASLEFDDLSELAIANCEKMPNVSLVANYIDLENEWPAIIGETFNWPQFVSNLKRMGTTYINILKEIQDPDPAVDDMITFWNKEINYKNAARGFGHDNEYCEADYRDNLIDPELQFQTMDNNPNDISDTVVDMYVYKDEKANNATWNGFEPMTTDMIVTGGQQVTADGDLDDIDTSIQEFEPDMTDYSEGFNFDDVKEEENE